MALWVDQLREARVNAGLEVEYLESLVTDLDADLAQFDEAETWMRRSEAAAATVLALYEGSPPTENVADLVAAVEMAGWQYVPSVTRNTIEDLRSTGNLRLIRAPELRRAIAAYYATLEAIGIPLADMRNRIWAQYDARVANVLAPGVRMGVLQRPESFGAGTTSDALEPAQPLEQPSDPSSDWHTIGLESGVFDYVELESSLRLPGSWRHGNRIRTRTRKPNLQGRRSRANGRLRAQSGFRARNRRESA